MEKAAMCRLFNFWYSSHLIDMVVMTSMIVMNFVGWAMITETSAVNFRQNLGEMLNQVQYRHDSVVINKDGKPVAVLVDTRMFERIRRMQEF
jgi:prevent-host-death family protein